jgi:hypothetical protein
MDPTQSEPAQTPDWYSGSINVYDNPTYLNAQCTACHIYSTTTEYNSFYSGKHSFHVFGEGFLCSECHDYSALAGTHFTGLNTSVISAGTASATIWHGPGYNVKYDGVTCTGGCHNPVTLHYWWQ